MFVCFTQNVFVYILGGLTFNDNLAIPQDLSWHNGVTSDYWNLIDWKSLRYSDEKRNTFEQEIYLKIYLGGIEPSIRKEVCICN